MLSELNDFVHQNIKSKIEQNNVESLCVTSDECILEANLHASRSNSPTTLNNNTIVINDDRVSEVQKRTFVNYPKGEEICDVDCLIEDNIGTMPMALWL